MTGTVVIPGEVEAFRDAVLRLRLEEVSRADAPAATLAEAVLTGLRHAGPPSGATRVPFCMPVPPDVWRAVDPRRDYAMRARLEFPGGPAAARASLSSSERRPVLTRGFGRQVELHLEPDGDAGASHGTRQP